MKICSKIHLRAVGPKRSFGQLTPLKDPRKWLINGEKHDQYRLSVI